MLAKLQPQYPPSGRRGRQPMALDRVLRIHCMQQWFTAANPTDIVDLPTLLREDDHVIFADAGYTSDNYKKG